MPGFASGPMSLFANTWVMGTQGAKFSGIITSGFSGYHCGRVHIRDPNDYSIQLTEDKRGDPAASCAVDVTLPFEQMKTQTRRLLNSALDAGDLRLNGARNFAGTLNGEEVTAYDCYNLTHTFGWDSSHLTHIHFEVLRENYANWEVMKNFLSVILGATMGEVEAYAAIAGFRMLLQNWAPTRAEWVAAGGDGKVYDVLNVTPNGANAFLPKFNALVGAMADTQVVMSKILTRVSDPPPIAISDEQIKLLAGILASNVADLLSERLKE